MPRVYAANEQMVKYLKHPTNKVGFRDMSTPANWPDDTFTKRRIRDGDVVTEEQKHAHKAAPKHHEEK
jgi:hypothetical protein